MLYANLISQHISFEMSNITRLVSRIKFKNDFKYLRANVTLKELE